MGYSPMSTDGFLNSLSRSQVDVKSFAHLATIKKAPLFNAILRGDGIFKEQTSDHVEWGVSTQVKDGVTFAQDYRGASRRGAPADAIKCSYRLPLQEMVCEQHDERELLKFRNQGVKFLENHLDEQEQQWNEGLVIDQEKKLSGVPSSSSDKGSPQGIFWYAQPNRDSNGVIEAAADGGNYGDRMMYGNGTTTTTRNGQDLSLDSNAKLRNWCQSIDHGVDENTVRAFEKFLVKTSFENIPFDLNIRSVGNIKNGPTNTTPDMKMRTGGRILCNSADYIAMAAFVNAYSPDDTGGEAVKFGKPRFMGFEREYQPLWDSSEEVYLDGEGTVWPYSPMVIIDWSKWRLDHMGPLWKKTPWKADAAVNTHYVVSRSASAQYNLRPKSDIRSALGLFYRTTAA